MYIFNHVYPPLQKDVADPATTVPSELSLDLGTATWTETEDVRTGDEVLAFTQTQTDFTLTHRRSWIVVDQLRLADLDQRTVDNSYGYDESEMQTFDQTLTTKVSASAKLKFLSLSASVSNQVTITQETKSSWFVKSTVRSERSFRPHTKYVLWKLLDIFDLQTKRTETVFVGPQRTIYEVRGPYVSSARVECAINYFEDDGTDPLLNKPTGARSGEPLR